MRKPYTGQRLKLDYSSAVHVLHELQMDASTFVRVVGDGDNGCYEWLIAEGAKVEHSNCGYGDSTVALRDGLIAYHGFSSAADPSGYRPDAFSGLGLPRISGTIAEAII